MSRKMRPAILAGVIALVAVVGTIAAALMALVGADIPCEGGTAIAAGPAPTKTALREIPGRWLTIYREAGSSLDISWPFLASIGYQECGHGTGNCYVVNPSGCAGPMEIAYVRGSECSPSESVPTIWERFKTDGDGDGKTSIFDPADAVFTAAKILREDDGAPPVGGSYSEYHEAACNYYGACSDPSANYADEVMARAVEYGFGDAEAEAEGASPETGIEGPRPKAKPLSPNRKATGPNPEAGGEIRKAADLEPANPVPADGSRRSRPARPAKQVSSPSGARAAAKSSESRSRRSATASTATTARSTAPARSGAPCSWPGSGSARGCRSKAALARSPTRGASTGG